MIIIIIIMIIVVIILIIVTIITIIMMIIIMIIIMMIIKHARRKSSELGGTRLGPFLRFCRTEKPFSGLNLHAEIYAAPCTRSLKLPPLSKEGQAANTPYSRTQQEITKQEPQGRDIRGLPFEPRGFSLIIRFYLRESAIIFSSTIFRFSSTYVNQIH